MAYADVPDSLLYPEELATVAGASERRRRAFAAGRHCAHRPLDHLGVPAGPLPVGRSGEPLWPAGGAGAITHCESYRAAAAARSTELAALGIDAEPHAPLPAGALEAVVLPHERGRRRALARVRPGLHRDKVLLSAKESVCKAWFPLTGRWLNFTQAELNFHPDPGQATTAGEFHARPLVAGPVARGGPVRHFTNRWMLADGLVVTAATA
ncbi:4'-phosphopantetheinyl transferase EntD (siderophore biosynthesis) [Streptomyces sp. Ncost-T6T-1]|uniref:4'-phosphopantetheinyl transferase family protein n=1 Tax=Streptomyces sp. Ncost-T6T-1 TaxID=1100828 RepID=UPI00080537E9|nr:4'-phosphopantetheinyl transferase superfamily protein [Streptomyces sp. Ncost-T6T-1]SBU98595.1 4'-phosphopantetheinyl transferase EntD (siderophore biosynthesis) [Streptomyces sp. Ncost-T6T-1]